MFRYWLHKLKKENTGSSMVIVIVALAFVGILCATIMWMSLNNFYMKATDTKHKKSFYTSETIMEQIVAGLQVDASNAIDLSYRNVLQKYSGKSEEERQKLFRDEYLNRLQEIFKETSGSIDAYSMDKLRKYVSGYPDPTKEFFSIASMGTGTLTAYKGGVKSGTKSEKGELERYSSDTNINDNYILLKDIHLEFTDVNGFVSIINTDIKLVLPEISFTQSSTMPDIFEFALVATDVLEDEDTTFSKNVDIKGSVYGGENGMLIHHPWKLTEGAMIVTDADITLDYPTAVLTVGDAAKSDKPMLWANNIKIIRGQKVDLNAKSYVANDLLINASGTNVKLQGAYFGFGDSLTEADLSSAIVINGMNTTLDMSKLDEVLLAGHSYVGTGNAVKNIAKSVKDDAVYQNNKSVLMGESIAVKGDQIAYLVPDECIGVLDGVDRYGKNPMSATEYEALQKEIKKCTLHNHTTYSSGAETQKHEYTDAEGKVHTLYEVDSTKTVTSLGAPIGAYTTTIKKIFVPSNGETVVYYYLVMDDETANKYFQDYYKVKKAKLDQYFSIYSKGIVSNAAFSRINMQGNWLSDADAKTVLDQTKLNQANRVDPTDLSTETKHYKDMYSALQAKLVTNYYEVSDAEKAKSVYENILITDDTALNSFLASHPICRWKTDDDGIEAVITSGDYTYTGEPKLRLLIAKGDITISADYTGLLIAGGKITITNGATITNASEDDAKEELTKVLQQPFDTADPNSKKPIDFFKNGSNYILAGTLLPTNTELDKTQKGIDFSEIVVYANWVKQ